MKEYKHKLNDGNTVPAFKGTSKCPNCGKEFQLDTVDPELFNKAKCLKCFMGNDK